MKKFLASLLCLSLILSIFPCLPVANAANKSWIQDFNSYVSGAPDGFSVGAPEAGVSIYGEGGLLETSCQHLFGEKYGKRIADIFRIRGKNGECPIFTACNVELWSNCNKVNLPMLWDTPVEKEKQLQFRERFAESTLATYTAKEMLGEILQEKDLGEDTRVHLEYLYESSKFCLKLCSLLTRYMDLYIEADEVLASAKTPHGDLFARCEALIRDADRLLEQVKAADLHPFDPMGGIHVRRDDMTDMVCYSTSQILKSLKTGQRVPEDRRPRRETGWW